MDPSSFLTDVSGLDAASERIYLVVLHRGRVTVAECATEIGMSAADVGSRLEALRTLGLVALRQGGLGEYVAVDPRFAMAAIARELDDSALRLRTRIPELVQRFEAASAEPLDASLTRVLTDPDAVAGWYARLQYEAKEEFLAFDRPPYVSASMDPLQAVVLDRGVVWRAIYASDSFLEFDIWDEVARWAERGEQARVAAHLPIKLAIADRTHALISLSLDPDRTETLLTDSAPLVEAMCNLFDYYWMHSLPVPVDRAVATPLAADAGAAWNAADRRGPTMEERAMLTLIGAGLKDEVVARQLGMSPRTLRRRSQDLMTELGAANRFQAGVEAARRGWV